MSGFCCRPQLALSRTRKCWVWLFIGIFFFLGAGFFPKPAAEVPLSLSLSAPVPSLEQTTLPAQKLQCCNLFFDFLPSELPEPLLAAIPDPPCNSPSFNNLLTSRILEGQPQFLPRPPPIC
jgi:hypothetical protein